MDEDNEIPNINRIHFSVFVHATEDSKKVKKAILSLLPIEESLETHFTTQNLKGHYGNPIKKLETTLLSKEYLKSIFKNLLRNLPSSDKIHLLNRLPLHLEKNFFYMRLDKQKAFNGILSLTESDPVKIKIQFEAPFSEKLTVAHMLERMLQNEKFC